MLKKSLLSLAMVGALLLGTSLTAQSRCGCGGARPSAPAPAPKPVTPETKKAGYKKPASKQAQAPRPRR